MLQVVCAVPDRVQVPAALDMSEYIPGNRHHFITDEYDFQHLPNVESDRPSRSSVENNIVSNLFFFVVLS
jgi:hypothetical protein